VKHRGFSRRPLEALGGAAPPQAAPRRVVRPHRLEGREDGLFFQLLAEQFAEQLAEQPAGLLLREGGDADDLAAERRCVCCLC